MRFLFRPPAGEVSALLDLPWTVPLADWSDDRIASPYRSAGRRVVRFISDGETVYALKELPESVARGEYLALTQLADAGLPAVRVHGVVVQRRRHTGGALDAILVTRYAEGPVPLRALVSADGPGRPGPARALNGGPPPPAASPADLLDALAALLVRLHAAGFTWAGCSLSVALAVRSGTGVAAVVLAAGSIRRHAALTCADRLAGVRQALNGSGVELLDLEHRGVLRHGIDPIDLAGELPRRYHARWADSAPFAGRALASAVRSQ